ncbi:helix-turn-helix domain-containing protein [Acinetobacter chinensis]|uniref:helix-turn-helix domain-containing protein n=1 Tax=Acinetobacter chinensis TaxID=2004650 RepID=UPI002934C8EB|nr:helix-turn-helix domain-containing protein [Acinetobacter chinensis]WOE40084.1 helix-turn-helix domain-containing protein [Acinetobacter chinensis]
MAKQVDLKKRIAIGRKLAIARTSAGLRQEDVSLKVFGITSKNRISEIENGETMPDAELLQSLCSIYCVSADWVLCFRIEPELDQTESMAGLLMNSIGSLLHDTVEASAVHLSRICAQHIASFPKSLQIQLLEQSKKLAQILINIDPNVRSEFQSELMELMECIRSCETDRAVQFNHLANGLDDLFERDEESLQHKLLLDLMVKKKTRYAQATLPKGGAEKPQPDFFNG